MAKRFSTPPLTAVRAFEAVARLGNFTKAAEELGTTQAAVSYQIKLLEEKAGVQLLLRQPKRSVLTEPGALLGAPSMARGAQASLDRDGIRSMTWR